MTFFLRFVILEKRKVVWYYLKHILCCLLLIYISLSVSGQTSKRFFPDENPISTEADEAFGPCKDTLKVLFFKSIIDINVMLPEWLPVEGPKHLAVLEGKVVPRTDSKNLGAHVSPVDHPLFHYTHDMCFNVLPDKCSDNRFSNLLAKRVNFSEDDAGNKICDTSLQQQVHVEWETGLAADNKGNPCAELNKHGKSCGFFTAGHERRDMIWNWPTFDDWVHVEGLWIWDRGHPPAYTEIHPARLVAIRRHLPALIQPDANRRKVYATRIDLFASGDGNPFYNNRQGVPDFVEPVSMSAKDYSFQVKPILKAPSKDANLHFMIVNQKGNSYNGAFKVTVVKDEAGQPVAQIDIPWKGLPDTMILAKTVYAYWDEGDGVSQEQTITPYKVTLESMRFKNRKEFLSRSNFRIFLEVGGNWIFLNEFSKKKNILDKGLGKTWIRKHRINQTFTIYVPANTAFRIHAGGWEADGVNRDFGSLLDPSAPCNSDTKKFIHKNVAHFSPFRMRGCMDDHIGEVYTIYYPEDLDATNEFEDWAVGDRVEDICLCSKGKQEKAFKLRYRIERAE